ncbi:methyltransferase, partial [Trypanosoma cruzi]
DELTTEARPLDVTVGSALLSDSAAVTAPVDRDATALMATDELTTEARPLDVTVGSALLSDSAAVTAPADRDATALMATDELTFVRRPMSVSVGMGTVCNLCGRLAADVTPVHVLFSVGGGEDMTNSRVASAARAVVVNKSNAREMGIAAGVLESDAVANALRRPLVELSGVEEVAAVEWRKGVSGENRPSVVSLAARSPSSERRVFTDVYPDRSFIPGSDVRRMVLVGKARVQNLTSASFERAFDGSARGTRAMEEGVEAPRPLPLLSAVEEGVGGGRRAASQSAKQPAAASAPADGVPRRGVRFASFALAPTPPPSSEQRRPVRIQRQYDAYQGMVPSWSDPAVLLPRPVLRLRPERVSPAKMQSSKLPPVRQQQEGTHPYHNNKNVQQHVTPRGAVNTLVQRPTGEAAPSVSHRRLAEVVTRLATSRTSSPQLHAQQSIYSLLPAVRTSPDQRDALYRQRRRRGSVSHARMGPTAAGPPTHMSFHNAPWGPALVSTWAHPMPRSTNGASQTGRFVGDRNVFYY